MTLREYGPMTAVELSRTLEGVDSRLVKNLCSELSREGVLDEHPNDKGGRRGRRYGAVAEAIPGDVDIIACLVDAYGPKLVRKLVKEAAS